jgi:hypothetical protein
LLEQAVRFLEREAEPWIPVGALCDSLENVFGLGACLSKRVEREGEECDSTSAAQVRVEGGLSLFSCFEQLGGIQRLTRFALAPSMRDGQIGDLTVMST